MPREEAITLVEPHIYLVGLHQFKAVDAAVAHRLLEVATMQGMLNGAWDGPKGIRNDPIKGLGPLPDTYYPWNVIDYLGGYKDQVDAPIVGPK